MKPGFSPTITLVIVGRAHKTLFFPSSSADADRSGNCPAGTVVDTGIVRSTNFEFYLYGHAGQLGTSKPARYTVLIDENNFTYTVPSRFPTRDPTADERPQLFVYVYGAADLTVFNPSRLPSATIMPPCTPSVSVPAPLYSKCFPHLPPSPIHDVASPRRFRSFQKILDARNVCVRALQDPLRTRMRTGSPGSTLTSCRRPPIRRAHRQRFGRARTRL